MSCEDGYLIKTDGSIKWNRGRDLEILYRGNASNDGTNTGINVNAGGLGKTLLVLSSTQWDAGSNTTSGIYMIKCGFNGNNYHVTTIANDNPNPTFYLSFSIDENGNLIVSSKQNTSYVTIIGNRNRPL